MTQFNKSWKSFELAADIPMLVYFEPEGGSGVLHD